MATTLIHAGVAAGAMNAILSGRYVTDHLAADYVGEKNIALAIADSAATQAATVALADADLATPNMQILCANVTAGVLSGRDIASVSPGATPVAADFNTITLAICAAVKAAIAAI